MPKYFKCGLEQAQAAHRKIWAMQEVAGWQLSRLSLSGSATAWTWADDAIGEGLLWVVLHADKIEFEVSDERPAKSMWGGL